MKQKTSGRSFWKWAFLVLLALNLAFCGVVAWRLGGLGQANSTHQTVAAPSNVKVGTFTSSREELNETVAAYLKKYQTKNNSYSFTANSSQVVFEGEYTLMGYTVPLHVYFTPVVLDDGSIQLDVTSVSAGSLSLPTSDVLRFIKSGYELPDFVEVDAKKSAIILNLPNIKNDAGLYIKATDFDLVNDKISFDVYKK